MPRSMGGPARRTSKQEQVASSSRCRPMPSANCWRPSRAIKNLDGTFRREIRELTTRVFEFSTLAVRYRIQAEILRLAELSACTGKVAHIVPAPTHAEIASRTSTHREAVTRELNRLAQMGILEQQNRELWIIGCRSIGCACAGCCRRIGTRPNALDLQVSSLFRNGARLAWGAKRPAVCWMIGRATTRPCGLVRSSASAAARIPYRCSPFVV